MTHRKDLIDIARKARASLPFSNICALWIGAIELGIRQGWQELVANAARYDVDLEKAEEHFISEPLAVAINFLRNVKGNEQPFQILNDNFDWVTVGSGFRNHKNEEIQQPDLVFKPRIAPFAGIDANYYGLFIEAKMITEKRHQRTYEYFSDGVNRFLDGRYAWAMRQGMMLAYVRHVDRDSSEAIKEYLRPERRRTANQVREVDVPVPAPNPWPRVHETSHSRKWRYEDRPGVPGDIVIRHLWLNIYD